MSNPNVIELINVSKIYKMGEVKVVALDTITLQIKPGEFVAIMGPSGSGKSTLLNILGCLDRPTQGQYWLDGEDVSQLSRKQLALIRNRKIGFVFQSYNLLAQSNALENVMLPILYSRNGWRSKNDRLERARAVLATVGLSDREKHKPSEMSGGQQQRVAIGRALVNDPAIILADEPTGNLDSRSGQEIMQILDELNAQGRTIVMVTHEAEVAAHAHRTLHMRDGRLEKVHVNGKARNELVAVAEGGSYESL
jgi:putative ABC transport system ATP-binding protein